MSFVKAFLQHSRDSGGIDEKNHDFSAMIPRVCEIIGKNYQVPIDTRFHCGILVCTMRKHKTVNTPSTLTVHLDPLPCEVIELTTQQVIKFMDDVQRQDGGYDFAVSQITDAAPDNVTLCVPGIDTVGLWRPVR